MYKKYVSTEKEKHAIPITNLYDPNIDYYKERENRMSSLKIDLGKGVSLDGGTVKYEDKVGPFDIKIKQKIFGKNKDKPKIQAGKRFKFNGVDVDVGAQKQGSKYSGGITVKVPLKKGGQI